jgi:glycosyltransferase involved in cell wall biosynthesis
MKNMITVITVTYNARSVVERTLLSVLEQTYDAVEYIVIDGQSSDGTQELLKRYADRINRLVIEADEGIYDAMNKALELASGEWVFYLNAGDTFISPDTLKEVAACFDEASDVFYGSIMYVDEAKGERYLVNPGGTEEFEKRNPIHHQAAFVRCQVMKDVKFETQYVLAGDYALFLKLYIQGYRFTRIPLTIANYLGGGRSEQDRLMSRLETLKVLMNSGLALKKVVDSNSFMGLLQQFSADSDLLKEYVLSRKMQSKSTRNLNFSKQMNSLIGQLKRIVEEHRLVALYGNGNLTKSLRWVIGDKLTVIADMEAKEGSVRPEALAEHAFDAIVIMVLGREKAITDFLVQEIGVEPSKIYQLEL